MPVSYNGKVVKLENGLLLKNKRKVANFLLLIKNLATFFSSVV